MAEIKGFIEHRWGAVNTLTRLQGGIENVVLKVEFQSGLVGVVRFYTSRTLEQVAAEISLLRHLGNPMLAPIPVEPRQGGYPVIADGRPVSMTSFTPGVHISRADFTERMFFETGRSLSRVHARTIGRCFRRYFDTVELIISAQWCLAELKPYPECAELRKFIESGIDVANKLAKEPDCCMIHSDIDQNNLLHDAENISLIDWDDTTYGHPALDLAITVRNLCLKRILRTPDADSIDLAAAARALNRGYGPFPSRIGLGEWVGHACHRYLVLMLYNSLRNPSYPSRERNNIELIEMAESAKLILNSACTS